MGQDGEEVGHGRRVGGDLRRKAQGRDRFGGIDDGRSADRLAIEEAAAPRAGREAFVAERVVDRGRKDIVARGERDRHAPRGKAVNIVGGAVERVDDPAGASARVAGGARRWLALVTVGLLADEAVVGKGLRHDPANLFLRGVVGLGDKIPRPLGRGAEAADPVEEHRAARPGGGFADGEWLGRGGIGHAGVSLRVAT